ncbi:MAG: class II aldolase/adducin family protein [Anaerolineales bacterium]
MLLREVREKILDISHKLIQDRVISNGQGNLSYYDRESGYIAITPSAVPYEDRGVEDICVIDLDETLIEGNWKPTSEIALHMVYYRNRSDIQAVVHTHAPYATIFGIIGEESMPMVLNEAAMGLGGAVPVAPYARPGTETLAEVTFKATGKGIAVIMAHHGLVTLGVTLDEAYVATAAAEHTARALYRVRSMGVKAKVLSQSEVKTLREMYLKYAPRPSQSGGNGG